MWAWRAVCDPCTRLKSTKTTRDRAPQLMYVGTLFLKHKGHTRRHAFKRWRHECHQRHRAMLEATIEDLKRKLADLVIFIF